MSRRSSQLVKIDVQQSRELQAAILALRAARREIQTNINRDARNQVRPLWAQALNSRAHTRMERALIVERNTASAPQKGVQLKAAWGGDLPGGLDPSTGWPGAEFGARSKRVEKGDVSKRTGRPYKRGQVIQRQFRGRTAEGQIAFDAASELGTKLVAIWVHTIVNVMAEIPGVEIQEGR